jgi:hypothetical protein
VIRDGRVRVGASLRVWVITQPVIKVRARREEGLEQGRSVSKP